MKRELTGSKSTPSLARGFVSRLNARTRQGSGGEAGFRLGLCHSPCRAAFPAAVGSSSWLRSMQLIKYPRLLLFPALLLVACGGAGESTYTNAPPPRGTLLQNPPDLLSTVTAPALLFELNSATNQ